MTLNSFLIDTCHEVENGQGELFDSEQSVPERLQEVEDNRFVWHVLTPLPESYKYQLRAYIYQARDLLAADDSGLSGKVNSPTQLTRTTAVLSVLNFIEGTYFENY